MNILLAIFLVVLVPTCGVVVGKLLAPSITKLYLTFLENLAETINQVAHSRQQKIQGSKPKVGKVEQINCIQDLRQFQDRVDEPIKQADIANLDDGSCNNLDGSGLNVSPQPTIKLISKPVTETTHSRATIPQEKESVNQNGTLLQNLHF